MVLGAQPLPESLTYSIIDRPVSDERPSMMRRKSNSVQLYFQLSNGPGSQHDYGYVLT